MKNELSNEQGVENFGVCAPKGFKINGLCERGEDGAEKGYTLLLSERRCSAAGVCAVSVKPTAPVYITKKHLASGYARGVFVNSGNALTYADNGEKLARNICSVVGQYAKISTDEILFCSTGRIGNSFDITDLESVLPSLVGGLGQDAIHEESAVKAFSSENEPATQLSATFLLGDYYPCRLGAMFKGGKHVCPNMATTLILLTTDVNISPEMLQRALLAETKETFNLLNVDGVSSPNDTVCILANGCAGNYRIDVPDSEYKKFAKALHELAVRICNMLALGVKGKRFACEAVGGISKRVSRSVASSIVGAQRIKEDLQKGTLNVESILYAIAATEYAEESSAVKLNLLSGNKAFVLYEDGRITPTTDGFFKDFLDAEEICLRILLGNGNYSARAVTTLSV